MVGVLIRLETIGVVAPNLVRVSEAIVAIAIGGTYRGINSISIKRIIVAKAVARC